MTLIIGLKGNFLDGVFYSGTDWNMLIQKSGYTYRHCLMMGIYSEKCIIRKFHHRVWASQNALYKPKWYESITPCGLLMWSRDMETTDVWGSCQWNTGYCMYYSKLFYEIMVKSIPETRTQKHSCVISLSSIMYWIVVYATLLYDWKCSRFYTSITTNM